LVRLGITFAERKAGRSLQPATVISMIKPSVQSATFRNANPTVLLGKAPPSAIPPEGRVGGPHADSEEKKLQPRSMQLFSAAAAR